MGVWGAVWLEKPIDSMTWRLSPTTKLSSDPVLLRSGPSMAKKVKENHRILKKIPGNPIKYKENAGLRSIWVAGVAGHVIESISL